jgi:hypothetical protein
MIRQARYGVYGLNVAAASFQAHVNFANHYASSILRTEITQTDPLYQTAWNAALDIACIRVSVLSARRCLTLPIELGAGYSDEDQAQHRKDDGRNAEH